MAVVPSLRATLQVKATPEDDIAFWARRDALWTAALAGNVHDIEQLISASPETIDNCWVLQEALKGACGNGHVDAVRWLVKNTALRNDQRRLSNAMRWAGDMGQGTVVKWLAKCTALRDNVGDLSWTLRGACNSGEVNTVMWLLTNTPLGNDSEQLSWVLWAASKNGLQNIMTWLLTFTAAGEWSKSVFILLIYYNFSSLMDGRLKT